MISEINKHLLISYLLGEANQEDIELIEKLLARDPELNSYLNNIREIWKRSGVIYDLQQIDITKEWAFFKKLTQNTPQSIPEMKAGKRFLFNRYWAAASIFLATAIASLFFYIRLHDQSGTLTYTHFNIPSGQRGQVILPDGTKVWLNAKSTLSYSSLFAKKNRDVTIEGEGYFEVAQDKDKPFHVITKDITIEVLGTVFNITAYPNDPDVETALLSGSISMTSKLSDIKTILKPNEKLTYHKTNGNITKTAFTSDFYSLWKEGEIIFSNELPEVAFAKLERMFDKPFVFVPGVNKDKRLTAHFKKGESFENMLLVIEETLEWKFEFLDGKILVSEKKK